MEYTTTPVSISPLVEERSAHLLREGLGFLYSKSLKEHKEYLPHKFRASYKPFALYEEYPTNPVAKEFIKRGGVYFPEEHWDTYVSLLGGNLVDIAFVLENFRHKKLVLNFPYDTELYSILLSLRDYPEETISVYEKLVSSSSFVKDNRTANRHYRQVKEDYYQKLGNRPVFMNSAILLYILHTGGFFSNFTSTEGIGFYQKHIRTLWEWHKVLASPFVSLYSTQEYTSIPLPKEGRNFIVSNTPESYTKTCVKVLGGWNQKDTRFFANYYNELASSTDNFLLLSGNTNPCFRSQFNLKTGWNTYRVKDNHPLPLYYQEERHRNNTDMCFISNYQLRLNNTELKQVGTLYTEQYLHLYQEYLKGLL